MPYGGLRGFTYNTLDQLTTLTYSSLTGRQIGYQITGGNWDALLDWTRDLSWDKGKGYVLILANADSLLSLDNKEFSIFVRVLEATIRDWRDERGEYRERTEPVPFHVVFSGTDALSHRNKVVRR